MVETLQEENATYIEEMMRDAKVAGESDIGVVHKGDEEAPAPMVGRIVRSATNVFIYNTVTREESKCNRNMLPRKLTLRRPDGSLVYTTRNPSDPPWLSLSLISLQQPVGLSHCPHTYDTSQTSLLAT